MFLSETEVAVKAVNQDFERVLERVKILLTRAIARRCGRARLPFESESAEVSEQVPENVSHQ